MRGKFSSVSLGKSWISPEKVPENSDFYCLVPVDALLLEGLR
jgi:hypothetical protein